MCTRGNFLGLSLMACHVTAGWVAPSVHIADSVKSASPSLDILTLITPDGLSNGARWWCILSCCHGGMGIPFGVHCRRRSYGIDVCTVICIVHHSNEYQYFHAVPRGMHFSVFMVTFYHLSPVPKYTTLLSWTLQS